MPDIRHEPDAHRFATEVDGGAAELVYERDGDVLALVHTFVPRASRGEDVGTRLVEFALGYLRDNGMRMRPLCPFVKAYVESHPDAQDLVAGS